MCQQLQLHVCIPDIWNNNEGKKLFDPIIPSTSTSLGGGLPITTATSTVGGGLGGLGNAGGLIPPITTSTAIPITTSSVAAAGMMPPVTLPGISGVGTLGGLGSSSVPTTLGGGAGLAGGLGGGLNFDLLSSTVDAETLSLHNESKVQYYTVFNMDRRNN